MSHKSGGVIIQSAKALPAYQTKLTPENHALLDDIEQRDEYTLADRLFLGYVVSKLAPEPAE